MGSTGIGEIFTFARHGHLGQGSSNRGKERDKNNNNNADWAIVVLIMIVSQEHHADAKIGNKTNNTN